jgi:hypothetical protein
VSIQRSMGKTKTSPPKADPERDAWIANFYTENHLAYEAFPHEVASPEQLRFIVFLEGEPHYYPCADKIFETIIEKKAGETLTLEYMKVWERLEPLVRSVVENGYRREFLLSLLRNKFRHESTSLVMLPSRLEKRLLQIFTSVSEIGRPLAKYKDALNRRAYEVLRSQSFKNAFNDPRGLELAADVPLDEVALAIKLEQIRRLVALTAHPELWTGTGEITSEQLRAMMTADFRGSGWRWLEKTLRRWMQFPARRYLLWTGVSAGEVLVDVAIIRLLIGMGINVIISVKKDFYYESVTMSDILEDPSLHDVFADADMIMSSKISKKDLLERLQSDKMLFVISDGSQERFNPLLTSITFARAFKEADAVVIRAPEDAPAILDCRFSFTRDILVAVRKEPGTVTLKERQRHSRVIRFAETDLRRKAKGLIDHLRAQKRRGKTIMFYSAIVGSIPNQLETAKRILEVFVGDLRGKQEGVLVINPAEYFESGMDADDIMYMWEIVQRSGLIDIWRFQSVSDVEKAFELMREKVPPEWVGKDATYSTGCTKEMEIALEVQKQHPEMQIIGPPWEKFLRRREYGVGKLYDRVLGEA